MKTNDDQISNEARREADSFMKYLYRHLDREKVAFSDEAIRILFYNGYMKGHESGLLKGLALKGKKRGQSH